MTSRERVAMALNHQEADRVPVDQGACGTTGMHVTSVYLLRQAFKLDEPGTPVKVVEPYQMLGEIADDLKDALGIDTVGLGGKATLFGFENENWREWETFDGTPVLIPEGFNTDLEPNGDLLLYPMGDKSCEPSGRMPKDGYYFDAIIRQPPIDDANLNVEDNLEEFNAVDDDTLAYFRAEANRLYTETDRAILANFGGTAFGDIALVPAMWLKNPKGIRDVAEWYMSTVCRRDYVYEIFERQCEIALGNLVKFKDAVGSKITGVFMTGTDFGTQAAPFISPDAYCDLYQPFHKKLNDWIHENTEWKTFIHSCGSVRALIPHFIESGFDILNPVQCSAAHMDAQELKDEFGKDITFWGGGVDTQQVLPFGTPEEIRAQVRERIKIFAPGGGYVFNTIHNVQARIPVENLMALYETVKECGAY